MNHQGKKTAAALWITAAVCVLSIAISIPVYAQLSGATLSGIVKDESGGSVPNASVSLKQITTGAVREVTTNADGLYSAPNLAPGDYELKVSAKGFSTLVQKGVSLTVGAEQSLNFTLHVGQITQMIEVTEAVPTVELTSSTISAVVDSNTVRELPLNGRDWTQLATLQPGVLSIHAQALTGATANRGNRGFGDQLTDSGHRPNENTYRVNGISINDYSNGAPGSVLGANLGVDAIQEFSVVTTNYTAEYGRTSGAVINAITKSGTNQFHGTGYFFDRDKIFDARNFFDGAKVPPFRRIQFGAAAGGPIFKDKTFIFGDYEGVRQNKSQSSAPKIPNVAEFGAGNATFSYCGMAAGCTAAQRVILNVDPLVQPFLPLWTGAKGTLSTISPDLNTQTLLTSGVLILTENYYTVKLDHKISDKDSINGSYFFDSAPQSQPDALNNVVHQVFARRQMVNAEWNHIFSPSLFNVFRAGFSRVVGLVNQPVKALNPLAASTTLTAVPGSGLFAPLITGTGLGIVGGLGNPSFFGHHWNSVQAYDDVFLSHGKHSLKFGAAFERMQYNVLSFVRRNGSFNFGGLQSFLTNNPVSVLLLDPSSAHRQEVASRDSLFGFYAQDDWRLRPNLTLNIGLRYEMLTNPTEAHNRFADIGPYFVSIATGVNPTHNLKNRFASNPTLRDFEPRIGFSWDPFSNGKTAVRGGFGIFDALPLPYLYTIADSLTLPNSLTVGTNSALSTPIANRLAMGDFPTGASLKVPFTNLTSVLSRFLTQDPHRNYVTNWNLNVQRDINSYLSAMVGYVGSHTVHLPMSYDDSNQVVPSVIAGRRLLYPVAGGAVANVNVGPLRATILDGTSSYEGLQAQFRVRQTHGFQAQASYTWSKCLDDGSGAQLGDPFQNSLTTLVAYGNRIARRGPCDFDITHNFVLNSIYRLPSPKFDNSVASWAVGGWEMGWIVSASTGTRFTMVMNGDPANMGGDANPIPDRLKGCNPIAGGLNYIRVTCFSLPLQTAAISAAQCNLLLDPQSGNPGCLNLFGNAGRNELTGPRMVNFDFSLYKNNYIRSISENFNVQFRAEFFNVFNHTNFQAPLGNLAVLNATGTVAGGAGVIDSTVTPSRQIQFGLKIVW